MQHSIAQFATAMQQLCYYESVLDGAQPDYAVQEDMWRTQVEEAARVRGRRSLSVSVCLYLSLSVCLCPSISIYLCLSLSVSDSLNLCLTAARRVRHNRSSAIAS
jgi:hypothetical protein